MSKKYNKPELDYWYAYHDQWDKFLQDAEIGIFLLGCVGLDRGFAIPYEVIHSKLSQLNVTTRRGREYWHIKIKEIGGKFYLLAPSSGKHVEISRYALLINETAGVAAK